MDRSVREHLAKLKATRDSLTRQLMTVKEKSERNRIEAEIRAATMAISHFEAGLDMEHGLDDRNIHEVPRKKQN